MKKKEPAKKPWKQWIPDAITTVAIGAIATANWYDSALLHHFFPPSRKGQRVLLKEGTIITHEELESRLGFSVVGNYSDAFANDLIQYTERIRRENPELPVNVKTVEVIPKSYQTNYSGVAYFQGRIALKEDSGYEKFVHECSHERSYHLSEDFWEQWTQGAQEHYLFKNLGILFYPHRRIFGDKRAEEFPKAGILTSYGGGNRDEDLGEFVEDAADRRDELAKINPEEAEIYINRIDLLEQNGFLGPKVAKEAKEAIGSKNPLTYIKILQDETTQLTPPHLQRIEPNMYFVYTSPNNAVSIGHGQGYSDSQPFLMIKINSSMARAYLSFDQQTQQLKLIDRKEGNLSSDFETPSEFIDALNTQGYGSLFRTHYPVKECDEDKETLIHQIGFNKTGFIGPVESDNRPYSPHPTWCYHTIESTDTTTK